MKKLWSYLGILVFWLSWPALFLYLNRSRRTRILVICGDEVLLTKGWLGVGRWELPGGGLHHGEDPVSGALRELSEETGIKATPAQLKLIHSGRSIPEYGLAFDYTAYALVLDSKPALVKQRFELTDLQWQHRSNVVDDYGVSPDVIGILTAWSKS